MNTQQPVAAQLVGYAGRNTAVDAMRKAVAGVWLIGAVTVGGNALVHVAFLILEMISPTGTRVLPVWLEILVAFVQAGAGGSLLIAGVLGVLRLKVLATRVVFAALAALAAVPVISLVAVGILVLSGNMLFPGVSLARWLTGIVIDWLPLLMLFLLMRIVREAATD